MNRLCSLRAARFFVDAGSPARDGGGELRVRHVAVHVDLEEFARELHVRHPVQRAERLPNARLRRSVRSVRSARRGGIDGLVVQALDAEENRARAVRAAGDHRVLLAHPAAHEGAALQARVDVAGDGVPGLRAVRNLAAGGPVRRLGGLAERVQAPMPEVVRRAIARKEEGIAHMVAGAGAGVRICAVGGLQFRIDLFVDYGETNLVLHDENPPNPWNRPPRAGLTFPRGRGRRGCAPAWAR